VRKLVVFCQADRSIYSARSIGLLHVVRLPYRRFLKIMNLWRKHVVFPQSFQYSSQRQCTIEKTIKLKLGCLCPVVVHNDYVVLDRHTHNTFTGTTILL
jgi:hypothetical protein